MVELLKLLDTSAVSSKGESLPKGQTKSESLRGITAADKFPNLGDSPVPKRELFPYCNRS